MSLSNIPALPCRYPLFSRSIVFFLLMATTSCATIHNTPLQSSQKVQLQLAETYPDALLDIELKKKSDVIRELLKQPLTPQIALRVLLLNSPSIQTELMQLGVADAARLQASLVANPRFSITLLKPENANHWLWDFGLTQTLADFFTRSRREEYADIELSIAQLKTTRFLQAAIHEYEQKYFAALASQQQLHIQQTLMDAATAKKELAESLFKAGNFSELNYLLYLTELQTRNRFFLAQQTQSINNKAEIAYLLGITPGGFILPEQLPELPKEQFDQESMVNDAINTRIDIKLVQLQQQAFQKQLNIVRKEYGIYDSSIGVNAKKENDGSHNIGPQFEASIPLFDNGQSKIAEITAKINAANTELTNIQAAITRDISMAITAIQLSSTLYIELGKAHKTAQRRIELTQREVNFMLANPFDLIELKAQSIQLEQEQVGALLEYWQARSQLELAVGKRIPLTQVSDEEKQALPEEKQQHSEHHLHTDLKNSGVHNHD